VLPTAQICFRVRNVLEQYRDWERYMTMFLLVLFLSLSYVSFALSSTYCLFVLHTYVCWYILYYFVTYLSCTYSFHSLFNKIKSDASYQRFFTDDAYTYRRLANCLLSVSILRWGREWVIRKHHHDRRCRYCLRVSSDGLIFSFIWF
jgi:hypothetical protein